MIVKLSMICSKQDNDTYFALCPEIKGCFTQGDTYEDAFANLRELVEISIKEELAEKELEEILLSKNKIFSEFEVMVS